MAETFHLRIITRTGTKFDGPAAYVRLPGQDGSFGVLPHHEPFLAALAPGEIVVTEPEKQARDYLASGAGVAEILNNEVTVLVETAEYPNEIDVQRAEEAAERARQRLCGKDKPCDMPRAEAALARATARLRVAREAGRD